MYVPRVLTGLFHETTTPLSTNWKLTVEAFSYIVFGFTCIVFFILQNIEQTCDFSDNHLNSGNLELYKKLLFFIFMRNLLDHFALYFYIYTLYKKVIFIHFHA